MSTSIPQSFLKQAHAAGAGQALRDFGVLTPVQQYTKEAYDAGAEQALRQLGVLPSDFEKDAQWGLLTKGLGGLGGKLLRGAGAVGKRVFLGGAKREAGKGVLGTLGSLASGASRTAGKPFAMIGEHAIMPAAKALPGRVGTYFRSAGGQQFLRSMGKGLPGQMGGYGLISGAMEAGMAQPGEDRFKKFLGGFGRGAALGAVMGGAGNLYSMGLRKAVGARGMQALTTAGHGPSALTSGAWKAPSTLSNIRAAGSAGWGTRLGQGLKARGARFMLGTGPLGGAKFLAGDIALAPFDMSLTKSLYQMARGQEQQRPLYAYPQIYTAPAAYFGQRYGAGGAMMGLAPAGYPALSPWQQQQTMRYQGQR